MRIRPVFRPFLIRRLIKTNKTAVAVKVTEAGIRAAFIGTRLMLSDKKDKKGKKAKKKG